MKSTNKGWARENSSNMGRNPASNAADAVSKHCRYEAVLERRSFLSVGDGAVDEWCKTLQVVWMKITLAFLPALRSIAAIAMGRCVCARASVCVGVCHTLVLCQND